MKNLITSNSRDPNTFGIYLPPGEKISKDFLDQLRVINNTYTNSGNFPNYQHSIAKLFKVKPLKITEECKQYLGGFLEGEGSLSVGAKKNDSSRFKVYIDPEFNITQHINGFRNLYAALCCFQTGRIRYKSGSNATMVYTIDNRDNLKQKVIPFYEKYVTPYGSPIKKRRVEIFKQLLFLFEQKAHLDLNRMVFEVLPLWDEMRVQVGHANQTFESLKEAQQYVKDAASRLDLSTS